MKLKRNLASLLVSLIASTIGVAFVAPPAQASVSDFCTSVGATQVGSTQECLRAFTSTGSTTWTLPSGITSIRYLVVGGGGGGQNGYPSNGAVSKGGRGGQVLSATTATVTSGATLTISVGAGGSTPSGTGGLGGNGGSSGISGGGLNLTATGGLGNQNSGAGSTGPSNDITGTSLVYGSGGGGSNQGSGTDSGVQNRGGGGYAGAPFDIFGNWSATGGTGGKSGVVYIRFAAAVAPSVSGNLAPTGQTQVGSTLTSATTYSAVPDPAMTYRWQSSTDGVTWTDIAGATSATFTPTADQVDKYIRVNSTATNDSGSVSDDSPRVGRITVPSPSAPSLAASSDLGSSNSDSVTSDTTPTAEATGLIVGATVTITATKSTDSFTCTFVATATSGGCTLPALTDGTWSVTSTQSLNGVNSPASSAGTISIDSSPPGLPAYSFTSGGSPIANGAATATNSITLASGPTSSGSSSIGCSLNGGPLQTPCPASFSPLLSGENNIDFVAVDASGNQTTDRFTFSYIGQSSLSLDSASDTGTSNSDLITSDSTPKLNVGGLVVGAQVTVSATKGGQTETCTFVATASTGNCVLPNLPDGSWSISSVQALGGSTTSPSTPFNVSIDTQAPSAPGAPSATPSGGTPVANSIFTSTTGVALSAPISAGQATGGYAEFYFNGVLVGTDASIGSGDTSVTLTPNLATFPNSGTLSVRLFDAAGNGINSSASAPLSVDLAVPAVVSFNPSQGQSLNTAAAPLSFDLVMSESVSGLSPSDFTNTGTATGCVFTPNASTGTSFTVTVTGCSAGTIQPQLNAGSISDGGNAGPVANSSVSGANRINFITTPPAGTGVPTLNAGSGSLTTLGSTLVSSAGTWNDQGDSAATTTYRWQSCTDPADVTSCTDIVGATSSTFVPGANLNGAYIRSVLTRTNAAGASTPQASAMSGPMARVSQTVTFAGPTTQTFSVEPLTLSGSSTSGLALTYTSLTPLVCRVSGAQVTLLSSGTCTIEATNWGNGLFLATSPVQSSFTVNRANQTLAIDTQPQVVAVGSSVQLAATAPGGGEITYAVTSGNSFCTVTNWTLTSTGVGDCTVEATIAQDGPYLAATSAPVTFQSRTGRTASLVVPAEAYVSDGSIDISAALSDGSTPDLTAGPATVCRVSGTKIELIGVGECSVSATASSNSTHTGADSGTYFIRVGGVRDKGPLITSVPAESLPGSSVNLTGAKLDMVSEVLVAGQRVAILGKTSTTLAIQLPSNLPAGNYDVVLLSGFGTMTAQGVLKVVSSANQGNNGGGDSSNGEKIVKKTVSGFAPGSSTLTSAHKAKLKAELTRLGAPKQIQCVGYTQGPTTLSSDRKLSLARAKAVCDFILGLYPESRILSQKGKQESLVGASVRRVEVVLVLAANR